MDNSNLPTVRSNSLEKLPSQRSDLRFFTTGFATSAGLSIAVYFLAHSALISGALFGISALFLVGRRLVQKSTTAAFSTVQIQQSTALGQIEEIKKQVSKCKFLENVEAEGTAAAQQAEQLLLQYKALKNIVGQKFNETEITYTRYLENIDASCLAIAENLDQAKLTLNHLDITAKQKTNLWDAERERVRQLLDKNGQVLEQVSLLFNALNEITTKEIYKQQLDQSLEQMKELTTRAKKYSKN